MRKLGAPIMAVLALAMVLPSLRADEGDGGDLRSLPPAKPSWWSSWSSHKDAAEPKKITAAELPPPRPSVPDRATIQNREENAYHRRIEVCLELMSIADQKNDDAMRERLNQLMDRAWEVYRRRTAGPGGLLATAAADEATLNRPSKRTVDSSRTAAVREVHP